MDEKWILTIKPAQTKSAVVPQSLPKVVDKANTTVLVPKTTVSVPRTPAISGLKSLLKSDVQMSDGLSQGRDVHSTQGMKPVEGVYVPNLGSKPQPIIFVPIAPPTSMAQQDSAKKAAAAWTKLVKINEMVTVPERLKASLPVAKTTVVRSPTLPYSPKNEGWGNTVVSIPTITDMTGILKHDGQRSGTVVQGRDVHSTKGMKSVTGISATSDLGDVAKLRKLKEIVNVPESMKSSVTEPVHPTSVVKVATIEGAKGVKTIKIKEEPIETADLDKQVDPITAIHCYPAISESGPKTSGEIIRKSLDAMFSESTSESNKETKNQKGKAVLGSDQLVKLSGIGLESSVQETLDYSYFSLDDSGMIKAEPGVITSGQESVYAHDYGQDESDDDSEIDVGIEDYISQDYVPGFDDDTSEEHVPSSPRGRRRKKSLPQPRSDHLTDEQRFELGKQAEHSPGYVSNAKKYSKLWGVHISSHLVSREHGKYQLLKLMYEKEPTFEVYLMHRKDGYAKLNAKQKAEILEHLKCNGATETARYFSLKYKVVLNETHIRNLAKKSGAWFSTLGEIVIPK